MRILGILMLLAVGSKAGINKLFFSGANVIINCPAEGTFYHWKKYFSDQMINLLSDDKRRLSIALKAESSPITYECSGTNGFDNYKENITVYVLDQQSTQARKLCFMKKSDSEPTAQYPCFLHQQNEAVTRVSKGSSVALDCEAGGVNVTYAWYRLNTPNSHQELMYQFANIPVFKIVDIDDKLAGQYLCIVNSTSKNGLKRFFDLQIFETEQSTNNVIFISGPVITNITIKLHKSQLLTCEAEAVDNHNIHLIQWAKKIDDDTTNIDKSLIIKWGDSLYKLIPEQQVQSSRPTISSVITSLELKVISGDSAGQYICAFFTNIGKMKHKSFFLKFEDTELPDGTQRSFLFLYILIPSLIIAICLFVGIYLTINRRSVRKASSLGTGTTTSNCFKADSEAMRLRTTPEYSMNNYPVNGPPTSQYLLNSNYPSSYYQASEKMIL